MINLLGKTLAVITAGLGIVFLFLALGIYTHQVDWGWREPRKELGERVPSEIDKRTAAVRQAAGAKNLAEQALKQAQGQLAGAEVSWSKYPLWAEKTLQSLYSGKDPKMDIRQIELTKGKVQVVPVPQGFGQALLKDKVVFSYSDGKEVHTVDVQKSFEAYHAELADLQAKFHKVNEQLAQEVVGQQNITLQLNGESDPATGRELKPGLHDLLEKEIALQKQIKNELENLRPLWVREMVDAQLLLERQRQLLARKKELEGALAAPGQ